MSTSSELENTSVFQSFFYLNYRLNIIFVILFIYGGDNIMQTKIKEYLSIDELIENIKSKNIKIKDENKLKNFFEYNNYYYITWYKEIFKHSDDTYKKDVYFEDIITIYQLDKKLKLVFAEVLFEIEQKVKTVFSNNFCKQYGYKDLDLIDPSNYDKNSKYLLQCLSKLNDQIKWYGKESSAVEYYNNKYGYIPVWVLMKVLTFGMVRDLIANSKSSAKGVISKKISNDGLLNYKEVQNMLELLIIIRNICCHDDKLIGYVHKKVRVMNTKYHKYFNIETNDFDEYLIGKKDLFATLICIKYFVSRETYSKFIDDIDRLITEYSNKIENITKDELLKYMSLPINFKEIKDL